jgi:hypothetical protein
MNNASSTAAAHTPVAGEGWIFKGGETNAYQSFPMAPPWKGSSGSPDYMGFDLAWYQGSSWTPPIFDAGGSTGYNPSTQDMISDAAHHGTSYLIIEGIVGQNLYFSSCNTSNTNSCGFISQYAYNESGGNQDSYWSIINVAFLSWNCPSTCSNDPGNESSFLWANQDTTSQILFSVIDGSASSQNCCNAMAAWTEAYNYIAYVDNAEFGEIGFFHDNVITNMVPPNGGVHGNCIHLYGSNAVTELVYNNYVTCLNSGSADEMFLVEETNSSATVYSFNNVMVEDYHGTGLEQKQPGTVYWFDNTQECGIDPTPTSTCIDMYASAGPVNAYNNLGVTSNATQNTVINTAGTLTSAPRVSKTCSGGAQTVYGGTQICAPIGTGNGTGHLNLTQTYPFAPLDSTAAATVGNASATTLRSLCSTISGINTAAGTACLSDTTLGVIYNPITHTVSWPARSPLVRPTSGSWTIGAYDQPASGQASVPSITLAGGSYVGYQQIGPITDSNSGTKITCGTIDGSTPVTNGAGTACSNGFALNDPSYFTVGATETVQLVSGTSTLSDSSVTSATYSIQAPAVSADGFGYQCQSNSVNCTSYTIPTVQGTPQHFRLWDCASPFYSTSTGGTNCTWASIESVTAGSYTWTALDNWMVALTNYRATNPGLIASYTFGMMPCTEVTFPGPFTITGVTGTTGSGTSGTITYAGSFGSTTLLGLYVTVSGMTNGANNITIGSGGVGKAAITSWSSSSITITGQAGSVPDNPDAGTLTIVPSPKGCAILPSDLPLSSGSPWTGTPPSPGGSTSFNNFVTALVNHCAASPPAAAPNTVCFYNTFNIVESWNEPNNNFFCAPGFCTVAQIYQMQESAMPIIRAAMTGGTVGGHATNKVSVQSIASTASAATSGAILNLESTNAILSDFYVWHEYFSVSPSVAPETIVGSMNTIAGKRSSNVGWANSPMRITETSWQSTANPYGCSQSNPWTLNDCIGQMVRFQLLANSNGISGLDWYNWDANIGKISAYQTAYYWEQQYLVGGKLNGACSNSSEVYTCPFTESNGTTALWVWNYCPNNGSYSSCAANGASYVVPSGYYDYRNLSGSTVSITPGNSITIGVQPFMLEQISTPMNLVVAPGFWVE